MEVNIGPGCLKIETVNYYPSFFIEYFSYAAQNFIKVRCFVGYLGGNSFIRGLSIRNDYSSYNPDLAGKLNISNQGNSIIYFNPNDNCVYLWHDWNGGVNGLLYQLNTYAIKISSVSVSDFSSMTKLMELKDYNGQPSF